MRKIKYIVIYLSGLILTAKRRVTRRGQLKSHRETPTCRTPRLPRSKLVWRRHVPLCLYGKCIVALPALSQGMAKQYSQRLYYISGFFYSGENQRHKQVSLFSLTNPSKTIWSHLIIVTHFSFSYSWCFMQWRDSPQCQLFKCQPKQWWFTAVF